MNGVDTATMCGTEDRWRVPHREEVVALCAERDALGAALADIAGMRLVHTEMDGTELWIADAECINFGAVCHQHFPDQPDEWCAVCVAEICWSAWKLGALT